MIHVIDRAGLATPRARTKDRGARGGLSFGGRRARPGAEPETNGPAVLPDYFTGSTIQAIFTLNGSPGLSRIIQFQRQTVPWYTRSNPSSDIDTVSSG
jgi:hypothetical protein